MEGFKNVEYKNFIPSSILGMTSTEMLLASHRILNKRFEALKNAYDVTDETYWKWYLKCRTNNWKKMHGYPMKRNINNKRKRRLW